MLISRLQHREIMKYQATFRTKIIKISDGERYKYKNTIIKQSQGCHWNTVMLKIIFSHLSFEFINKTKKGIVHPD